MKITDNPCQGCEKRNAECRLTCGRYKVYHTAKMKEYAKRRTEAIKEANLYDYIRTTIAKRRRGTVKYTPVKNGGRKK